MSSKRIITCSRCGYQGHNRSNRHCPQYAVDFNGVISQEQRGEVQRRNTETRIRNEARIQEYNDSMQATMAIRQEYAQLRQQEEQYLQNPEFQAQLQDIVRVVAYNRIPDVVPLIYDNGITYLISSNTTNLRASELLLERTEVMCRLCQDKVVAMFEQCKGAEMTPHNQSKFANYRDMHSALRADCDRLRHKIETSLYILRTLRIMQERLGVPVIPTLTGEYFKQIEVVVDKTLKPQRKADTCAICMDPGVSKRDKVITNCGHCLCMGCLNQYAIAEKDKTKKPVCVCCRGEYTCFKVATSAKCEELKGLLSSLA